ncbi:MAG: hypothetical protein MUC85_00845 [Anaerolineales bacterium]|jgi:hypothetical protein|nr:hypothetical protein [Anaerolineales bacterium]
MPVSLDLNFLPLVRQNGQDQPEWPGLYVATPPRGAARGRDIDLLALYLSVGGTAPLPPDQLEQLMPRLAQVYYRSSGTATAALKAVVDECNRILLERNLRASNTGRQGVGSLTQAVLRGDMLYVAHSGMVQTYLIKPDATTLWVDDVGGSRGLGVTRTASVRYFHTGLQPGDHLVFSHHPAAGWNVNTVRLQRGEGMEGLRRSLLAHSAADLQAVLVQVLSGEGKLRLLRLKSTPAGAPQTEPEKQKQAEPQSLPAALFEPAAEPPIPPMPEPLDDVEPAELEELWPAEEPENLPLPPPLPVEVPPREAAKPFAAQPTGGSQPRLASAPDQTRRQPLAAQEAQKPKTDQRPAGQSIQQGLASVSQTTGRALGKFFSALGKIFGRILPDETLLNISPSMMIFLAVLIPVLISVLGGMMYIQRGQALQHNEYLSKAQIAAERAQASQSPDEQRSNWRLVLDMLDEAEFYKTTEASSALRLQARTILDGLDGVERLEFLPALPTSLGDEIQITRMAARPGELYLLDGPSGIVLRALWSGNGFQLDRSFVCGPVRGEKSAGPLIDLVIPPSSNDFDAVVAGLDANGTLVFCSPGDEPSVVAMAPPPMNFRSPKSFTWFGSDLYVLDPGNNGIWIYRNMKFDEQPRLFFADQVPYMQDVLDIAVNGDDLFLLHSDGRLTVCYYSIMEVAPTRCDDSVQYVDSRPGRTSGPLIPDSLFDQIYFAPPPDPSLYLLDPANQAVFHFSLRLNFQHQYRSAVEIPDEPVSAFAVSSDRLVFMAVKNQVVFAVLP